MKTLIILCGVLFILSSIFYWWKSVTKKGFPDEMLYFFEAILIVLVFTFGALAIEEHKKAEGKCPELTPVQEQLYKIK